ncbi:Cell wall integrity protein scw1 [Monoraphidium neglectum]|uniref:Cell wall integrity protein scw1 n=1 Tax=Monoraphidium neglectum TaxID=145388 RepID=A0A0D2LYE2_9CHLO|nr:Cell wall integrity protein scw1 [Monoraphidium neglectum]KIY96419.1 Cell wall integrity protein scw1 [Monoraphidium neglectum]|eukprot:XP_013895439.1 Cell wall integrity protein scw1 [Monoraphidium neglectum]
MHDNPPCSTLFIGNLGPGVTEAELRRVFSVQPGYVQLRFSLNQRGVTCFVEFDSVENAVLTHTQLQGQVLETNDRGAMRIQFSKSPLNRKRDAGGNPAGGGLEYGAQAPSAPLQLPIIKL